MSDSYRVNGRFWIEAPDGTFLGVGRVRLLEAIQEHGSISAAARAMAMSYRHAWKLVDCMNAHSQTPVVEKASGGKGGGGTRLTEAGEQAIKSFRAAEKAFHDFLCAESKKLTL